MAINIKIDGEGLSYLTTTSILKASQVIAFLSAPMEPSNINNGDKQFSSTPLLSRNDNKSPREALSEFKATTNMQKILVLARYHLDRTGNISFRPLEIKAYFRKAGEPEPRNYGRDVKDAIGLNYIYEALDGNGDYVITDYGNELLKSSFENETKNRVVSRKSRFSVKKTNVEKVSPSVAAIDIVPKMEEVIPYHDIEKKGDRILWILYFAYQNSISELAPSEIEYVATKLLDKIPASSLTALSEKSRKDAYVTKTNNGKFKLLHDGIEYVKSLKEIGKNGGHIQEADGK